VVTSTASDPIGDTFGPSIQPWDVTALTMQRDPNGVVAIMEFSRELVAPRATESDTNAVIAFLDIDVDQNAATGAESTVDEFRSDGGATAIGVDRTIALIEPAVDGTVPVLDANGREMGRVLPVFDGRRVTIRVPRALLGNSNGGLNVAAIVGARSKPSDFVPNAGHLTLAGTH